MIIRPIHCLLAEANGDERARALILKQWPALEPKLDSVLAADPSPNKANSRWIARLISKAVIKWPEDAESTTDLLQRFEQAKTAGVVRGAAADILRYQSAGELSRKLDELSGVQSKGATYRDAVSAGTHEVYHRGKYRVVQISTPEAARSLCQGARWCVKDLRYARAYLRRGPLYLVFRDEERWVLVHGTNGEIADAHNDFPEKLSAEDTSMLVDFLTKNRDLKLSATKGHFVDLVKNMPVADVVKLNHPQLALARLRSHLGKWQWAIRPAGGLPRDDDHIRLEKAIAKDPAAAYAYVRYMLGSDSENSGEDMDGYIEYYQDGLFVKPGEIPGYIWKAVTAYKDKLEYEYPDLDIDALAGGRALYPKGALALLRSDVLPHRLGEKEHLPQSQERTRLEKIVAKDSRVAYDYVRYVLGVEEGPDETDTMVSFGLFASFPEDIPPFVWKALSPRHRDEIMDEYPDFDLDALSRGREDVNEAAVTTSVALPTVKHARVYHVGSLNAKDRGKVGGAGNEGDGLAVSMYPSEWRRIARLGGHPTWILKKAGGVFVDVHKVSENARHSMRQWATQAGLVTAADVWRATWYDDEFEDDMAADFETEQEARDEYGETATIERIPGAVKPTSKFNAWYHQFAGAQMPLALVDDMIVYRYAEQHTPYDGLWWNEILDPDRMSAPRGSIFPRALPGWSKTRVSEPEAKT